MTEDQATPGWETHAHAQLQAWLRLSPRQRLDWLWRAKCFAERARKAVNERRADKAPRGR